MSAREKALAFARRGIKVFLLAPNSKIPLTANGHGHLDATDDLIAIAEAFDEHPDANYGIAAAMSGLAVVDVDIGPKKGGGTAVGDQTLQGLVAAHDWYPNTFTVETPRGGSHYYMKARPGASYRGELGPDIQLKSNGYVVGPGSVIDGVEYKVVNSQVLEDAPEWMEKHVGPKGNGEAEWDRDMVEAALRYIDPCGDRPEWLPVYMAIHAGSVGSQEGYKVADEWSSGRLHGMERPPANYDPLRNSRDWDSFKVDGDITLGTLFFKARENGWEGPPRGEIHTPPIDDAFNYVKSWSEILAMELPKETFYLEPIIPDQAMVLIYGPRGKGKSSICLAMALAINNGESLWGFKSQKKGRVLIIDGDMPIGALQPHMETQDDAVGFNHEGINFMCGWMFKTGVIPNLRNKEGQEFLDRIIDLYDVIFFDNEMSLFRGGDENNAEYWGELVEWLLSIRQRGKTIILVHHSGKSGDQRGTSAREDLMDVIVKLDPVGEEESLGIDCELVFTKARRSWGDVVRTRWLKLEHDGMDRPSWCFEKKGETAYEKAKRLFDEIYSDPEKIHWNWQEMASFMGLKRSQFYEYKAKYERSNRWRSQEDKSPF